MVRKYFFWEKAKKSSVEKKKRGLKKQSHHSCHIYYQITTYLKFTSIFPFTTQLISIFCMMSTCHISFVAGTFLFQFQFSHLLPKLKFTHSSTTVLFSKASFLFIFIFPSLYISLYNSHHHFNKTSPIQQICTRTVYPGYSFQTISVFFCLCGLYR